MTDENFSSQKTTFNQRMRIATGAFLRALLRLFVIAVVLGLLAVGLVYGVRQLNHYYERTQESILRLEESQASQDKSASQLAENLEALEERINAIEIQNDTQKQAVSKITGQIQDIQNQQQAYLDDLENAQTGNQTNQEDLNERLEKLGSELESLSSQVEQTDQQLEDLGEQITALEDTLETGDLSVAVLRRDLQLVKAMELMTRSRLFLVENNLGLAKDDIQSTRDLLAMLTVPDYQQAALDEIIQRLDLALENLLGSPILAAEDLEIAWQLLKQGLPDEPSTDPITEATNTPEATATVIESTATPTPNP